LSEPVRGRRRPRRAPNRVVLSRTDAEALASRAIPEEKNIGTLVTELLESSGEVNA
jgi:hypothetical protein